MVRTFCILHTFYSNPKDLDHGRFQRRKRGESSGGRQCQNVKALHKPAFPNGGRRFGFNFARLCTKQLDTENGHVLKEAANGGKRFKPKVVHPRLLIRFHSYGTSSSTTAATVVPPPPHA